MKAKFARRVSGWLIAEYCDAQFFTGWHLYWRERIGKQPILNSDGEWGWIRSSCVWTKEVRDFVATIDRSAPEILYVDSAQDDISQWRAFVDWFAETFPSGLAAEWVGNPPRDWKARRSPMKGQSKKRVSKRRREQLAWRAKRKRELWDERANVNCFPTCGLCGLQIIFIWLSELDHKIPVRRGGDTDENTHLVHALGNRAKGSVSLEKYLELPEETRKRNCGVGELGKWHTKAQKSR